MKKCLVGEMMVSYETMTEKIVERRKSGSFLSTPRLRMLMRKEYRKEISCQKAARLLDACMSCISVNKQPRLWKVL